MCTMNPKLTSGQRLMAESQHMGVEVKVAADKLDRLEAQNAKLRELVHDFALFAEDAVNKYGIELEAGHDVEAPPAEWKECLYELEMLVNRMRELGIEASNEHS